jgi:hypothetical protein
MLHAKELSNFPHHNNTRTTKILLLLVTKLVYILLSLDGNSCRLIRIFDIEPVK